MNTFILYALLCTPLKANPLDSTSVDDSQSCVAYELGYSMSEEDCDSYFTDSGVAQAEKLMLYYIPEYKLGDNVILSCEVNK